MTFLIVKEMLGLFAEMWKNSTLDVRFDENMKKNECYLKLQFSFGYEILGF